MKTLLLADDDSELLESLAILFRIEGFRVLSANDGEDALTQAKSQTPHLIVTDLNMPRMDGGALAKHVRATPALASVPVVMMSSDPCDGAAGSKETIDGYLRKPVDFPRVLAMVEALTDRARAARIDECGREFERG